jgi:hypothetical protein
MWTHWKLQLGSTESLRSFVRIPPCRDSRAILFGWILKKYGRETWQNSLTILIWGMALFGVIFSIYLTYLEPFVIGATCMWCIASAIIITLQFWASSEPLRRMWMVSDDDLEDG